MLCDNLEGGMGWEGGESFEREGTHVHLWLTCADVWQRPTHCYKPSVLQLKIIIFFKRQKKCF